MDNLISQQLLKQLLATVGSYRLVKSNLILVSNTRFTTLILKKVGIQTICPCNFVTKRWTSPHPYFTTEPFEDAHFIPHHWTRLLCGIFHRWSIPQPSQSLLSPFQHVAGIKSTLSACLTVKIIVFKTHCRWSHYSLTLAIRQYLQYLVGLWVECPEKQGWKEC